ncbi:MAG: permease [Mycobacterium leprae]
MTFLETTVVTALMKVLETLAHNWPLLLLSILVATVVKVGVDQQKVAAFLRRHQGAGVVGATIAAVTTPFCSCGTTAVVLGMMSSLISWAPIVAFMVASPLTSPEELFYSAGLFGWSFALTYFVASVLLGLLGGLLAYLAEQRGWLRNQARIQTVPSEPAAQPSMAGSAPRTRFDLPLFARELWLNGRRLLLFFLSFAFIGYLLNGLIPQSWVGSLFGNGHVYGVPLAATLGLPLYINSDASLPLVRSLLDAGMSPGASMAFLITGAGTSLGAIIGALSIARWRIIALVVGTLWVGAVCIGYAYNAAAVLGV